MISTIDSDNTPLPLGLSLLYLFFRVMYSTIF